jgi:hypothetical protein
MTYRCQESRPSVDVMQFGQVPNLLSTKRRYWHGASLTVEQIRGAGYQGAARGSSTHSIGRMRTRPTVAHRPAPESQRHHIGPITWDVARRRA